MNLPKKLQSALSVLLVLLLALGMLTVFSGAGHSQPDNPIEARNEPLYPETAAGSSSLWGENGENTGDDGSGDAPNEGTPQPTEQPEITPQPETTPTTPPKQTTPTPQPEQTPEPTQEPTNDPGSETDPSASPDPDKPDDGKGDDGGGKDPGKDDGGGSDTDNPGGGSSGGDGDGGSSGGDGGQTGDEDDTPRIYTDLYNNKYVTKSELPDGNLKFFAYPLGKGEDLSVKVVLQNDNTPANGTTLQSADGKNYVAPLVFNSSSYITIYLREKGENIGYVRSKINYYADKSNEENPEVGDNPPTIITSLDGESLNFTTQHLLFWVRATTHPDLGGKTIYSNQIQVWLDGELQEKQSGDARPEYDIYFPLPNVEGTVEHVIKVLAWDGNGNSTYKYYNVTFTNIPEGVIFGEVTVVLDATAAGRGVLASGKIEVTSGETVASAVLDFLKTYGYSATYDGTPTNAFYLRKIGDANLGLYSFIPVKLQEMLERDGATFTGAPKRDSLGEFDFTRGSGWMYAIDGDVYPGRSMSLYPVRPGMTIYLRFTLAYGKDIGGFVESGSAYGSLSSYCRRWINNNFNGEEMPHDFIETGRVEPTDTEDGYIEYTCSRCHETKKEILPKETPVEPTDPPVEPTDPPVEPTDPPVQPTDPPVQPTDPPVEPTDPPVQPTDPPVQPTDPPDASEGPES